jgi:hypothetical protein
MTCEKNFYAYVEFRLDRYRYLAETFLFAKTLMLHEFLGKFSVADPWIGPLDSGPGMGKNQDPG